MANLTLGGPEVGVVDEFGEYYAWFGAKVERAMPLKLPGIPHDQVMTTAQAMTGKHASTWLCCSSGQNMPLESADIRTLLHARQRYP